VAEECPRSQPPATARRFVRAAECGPLEPSCLRGVFQPPVSMGLIRCGRRCSNSSVRG